MAQLSTWNRTEPGSAIQIVFNSPGGEVTSGLALYDFILSLRADGHHITTTSLGMAASMAGILLQAGDTRSMASEAWLLIHEASFGVSGSFGDVEDRVKWIERIQDRILDIFAARSNLTKGQIKRRWHRKDWWLSSDEALTLGFIDEIA
jgi:ATP-dependent Clp protease protease subunit